MNLQNFKIALKLPIFCFFLQYFCVWGALFSTLSHDYSCSNAKFHSIHKKVCLYSSFQALQFLLYVVMLPSSCLLLLCMVIFMLEIVWHGCLCGWFIACHCWFSTWSSWCFLILVLCGHPCACYCYYIVIFTFVSPITIYDHRF